MIGWRDLIVEESTAPDSPSEPSATARFDAPAMPDIPPGTMWRDRPYVIVSTGQQYSLGWQDARKTGHCFVIARLGAMGSRKVLDRFPLTQEGWAMAWAALARLDPCAGNEVLDVLAARAGADAVRQAERERRAQMYEAVRTGR